MSHLPFSQASRLSLASALMSAAMLGGCAKQEQAPEPVRSVKVLTVGVDSFKAGHEFAGEVKPRVESRLGFRVAGKIVKRQAELGQVHAVQPGARRHRHHPWSH